MKAGSKAAAHWASSRAITRREGAERGAPPEVKSINLISGPPQKLVDKYLQIKKSSWTSALP